MNISFSVNVKIQKSVECQIRSKGVAKQGKKALLLGRSAMILKACPLAIQLKVILRNSKGRAKYFVVEFSF